MGLVRLRYRAQVSYRRLRFSRFGSKLRLGCNLGSDSMSGSLFSQNWSTMVNGSTPLFRLIIEVWMIDETSLGWLDTHLNLSIFCCYVTC
ncbi:hypothetical protein HanHA89_Chr13g0503461 [Helianthus annuus]|nr:hypothetical protein HanHA89_Chr13g0503461 [Helianthus annuus]